MASTDYHTSPSVRLSWSLASLSPSLSSKITLLVVVPLTFVRTTFIPGLVLSDTANLMFECRGRGTEDDEVVSVLRELMSSLTPRPWWTSRTFNLWERLIKFTLRWFWTHMVKRLLMNTVWESNKYKAFWKLTRQKKRQTFACNKMKGHPESMWWRWYKLDRG